MKNMHFMPTPPTSVCTVADIVSDRLRYFIQCDPLESHIIARIVTMIKIDEVYLYQLKFKKLYI